VSVIVKSDSNGSHGGGRVYRDPVILGEFGCEMIQGVVFYLLLLLLLLTCCSVL